ncbi:lysophosphatidylcholine acyltransferase 2 [Thecamonas trahens ATCC 50062]|uniref:Lysophosphatidylcholine acyltransferase 2 n=1 Tax=Thecamonas trahens ATCC 50062 TaxID=461836 RepID=A0A0L0DNL0_THETB|nr:lysophosphatidylcholine acyltransferase 2 [Thecamonas trahens ATCC 50062]KNC53907.1 lysophosphatidylcholine acyltransferase 2 [Thecamonas trahens ATCC 50062]|eukprot:XP_013754113.1 lysophosphatidylcholine acyltransferase 2 [Thecamonas trahens ATCC 50062]
MATGGSAGGGGSGGGRGAQKRKGKRHAAGGLSSSSSSSASASASASVSVSSSSTHVEVRAGTLKHDDAKRVPGKVNPFLYTGKSSVYEKIKLTFMTVTFFPVRLILILLSLVFISMFCWLATVGLSRDRLASQPIAGCRRVFLVIAQYILRFAIFVAGFYWISTSGKRSKKVGLVACGPHTNFLDPAFMYWLYWPSGVSAAENARVCFVGAIIRASQAILVDRGDPESRRAVMDQIRMRAESDEPWPATLLFPEGTCTTGNALITFKAGAFVPGVPVQPVALKYQFSHFDPSWVPTGPGKAYLFWRILCQFVNRVHITYLPVYSPSREEKSNAKLFGANVRAVIANELGVPVTEHTYADNVLANAAIRRKFPPEAAVVEFGALHQVYNYSLDDVKLLLDRFAAADTDGDGLVSEVEFAELLGLELSEPVSLAFQMFDTDSSGLIDFREWLIGIALANNQSDREEVLSFAFQLFDPHGKGRISRERFVSFIGSVFPAMTGESAAALFDRVDARQRGYLSFKDFKAFAGAHPEYYHVFLQWNAGHEVDIDEWRTRASVEYGFNSDEVSTYSPSYEYEGDES